MALPITGYECHGHDGLIHERSNVRRRGATPLSTELSHNGSPDGGMRDSKRHALTGVQTMDRILTRLSRPMYRLCSICASCITSCPWRVPCFFISSRWIRVLGLATALGSLVAIILKRPTLRTQRSRILATYSPFHVVFQDEVRHFRSNKTRLTMFRLPRKLNRPIPNTHFYNGLLVAFVASNGTEAKQKRSFQRMIPSDAYQVAERHRRVVLFGGNDATIPYQYWYEEDVEGLHRFSCRKVSWVKLQFLNCNTFHELSLRRDYSQDAHNLQPFDNYLVNHGFYRDIWVNQQPATTTTSILKTTRYQFDFGWRNLFDVHREALIMERLTKFPSIVSSYGHCGTSVLTEALPHEVEPYVVPGKGYYHPTATRQQNESLLPVALESQNKLTEAEKLETALVMAESIAVLHGYVDGVIVHDDVQLQQWLRDSNGTFKLGDFNRATILAWNDKEQRYCKFSNGETFGNYRAPEEFDAGDLDEKIDVYSFANNIYCLLTGLWPFYENEDDSVVQGKVSAGERALVPASPRHGTISRTLMNVMQRAWAHRPDERIDIFEAVQLLRAAMLAFNGSHVA